MGRGNCPSPSKLPFCADRGNFDEGISIKGDLHPELAC